MCLNRSKLLFNRYYNYLFYTFAVNHKISVSKKKTIVLKQCVTFLNLEITQPIHN